MENTALVALLRQHQHDWAPVVPLAEGDRLVALDFTEANTALTDAILNEEPAFVAYIESLLLQHGARYGIGGYGEHRTIYRRSTLFDAGEEPRRLHLGTDIWGGVGTAVSAPLDATVHSFGFHPRLGDYGAVIILEHRWQGAHFHTLYGHLDAAALEGLQAGQRVEKGSVFAHFGKPEENGHWPPHLHFQLVIDMGGRQGDYPGVCRYSERATFLANCPDPEWILQLSGRTINT